MKYWIVLLAMSLLLYSGDALQKAKIAYSSGQYLKAKSILKKLRSLAMSMPK